MNKCSNCQKSLEEGTNFCPRCGLKQELKQKCPICLDDKVVTTLLCGHNICITCINKIYVNKRECPICREQIEKCPECYNFRVVELTKTRKKCLDCKTKIINTSKIIDNNKIKCNECGSRRVLFDPITNLYKCTECFGYFNSNTTYQVIPVPKTRICMVCFSNLIEFFEHPLVEEDYDRLIVKNKCKNCEMENVNTKIITLEEYSKLRIKSKNEVNPDIVKICPECNSKDIYSINLDVNPSYNCNNCNKKYFIPKIVKC